MRFMMMHKHDAKSEAGEVPPMKLIEEMGAFVGEFARAGKLIDGAGLGATKNRTRLVFRDGQVSRKRGPYSGEKELPAAALTNEAWDLGLMPEPENAPLRYLLIEKADKATEGGGRTPQQKAAITRLKTEMQKAGVLQGTIDLAPSAQGKRLNFKDNVLQVTDGPFTESKELLGGFCVMEMSGMDEILDVCRRYTKILGGTLEIDVRVVEVPAAA